MRLGIMSFAHLHAEAYIGAIRALPGVEFIGFADDDRVRGEKFAGQFGARLFNSYADLLAQGLDGVVVCCENAYHADLVTQAAAAGVHILCEKPLATTLEDGQRMLSAVESAGVKLMTAFPMRFSAPVIEIKQMLDSGKMGRVYGVNSTNQGECPKYHRDWFVDPVLAGGGAVMDHTVHLADLLRWFFGCEVVEVYAQTNHIFYADEVDVETGGLVSLTFENGVFATIDCSWSKPPYYPTWGGLKMELVGEGGLVTLDAFKQHMTVYTHARQRPQFGYWGSDANQAMIEAFVKAIAYDQLPPITGYDGFKAMEIALAAYQSAALGAPVRLPLEA